MTNLVIPVVSASNYLSMPSHTLLCYSTHIDAKWLSLTGVDTIVRFFSICGPWTAVSP